MLSLPVIAFVSLAYLGILFAIAHFGDRRADAGRSIIASPTVFALSIAVYCTSWTFYGSVGRAASSGVGFLPIYLGPTLTFFLGWIVIRKIIRISKANRVTSIADFIASRYGKSFELGILVSVIAVVGILPYISLQLKAISASLSILLAEPAASLPRPAGGGSVFQDIELYVALAMAAFAILFGARHIDASERHEGMVAAIAFESIVKLLAFLLVGVFVTWGLYDGFGDLFGKAEAAGSLAQLFVMEGIGAQTSWLALTGLAMAAIVVLPRQFQMLVVENVDERHLRKAIWLFPLYLLLINIFVLPIAFAGLLRFEGGAVDADTFVLTLPMQADAPLIALLAFIGGLSAATGMIIVETVALATMVSNDLVMPLLLRVGGWRLSERKDLTGMVLLQFAPVILAGIYWKGATKAGALAALSAGFAVWFYTLLLPSFARSGWISSNLIEQGPWGLGLFKPYALFGLTGLDPIAHATLWTFLVNVGFLVGVSLFTSQSIIEQTQAVQFVEIYKSTTPAGRVWRGRVAKAELLALLARFVGDARAEAAFTRYEQELGRKLDRTATADSALVALVERQLAGAIGAASARIMVASVLREEMQDIDEMRRRMQD
ncbi:MAG: histidine kinase [Microvirga sp.]|nr:histidine kinase [Microvirga sp.]